MFEGCHLLINNEFKVVKLNQLAHRNESNEPPIPSLLFLNRVCSIDAQQTFNIFKSLHQQYFSIFDMNRKEGQCNDKLQGILRNELTFLSRVGSKGEVVSKEKTLNGYLHNIYLRQISNLNRIFITLILLKLLLLYLYVELDLSTKYYSPHFLILSNICAGLAAFVLILRFQCKSSEFGLADEVEEGLVQLGFKIAIIMIGPYGFLQEVRFQNDSPSDLYDIKLNHLLVIFSFYKNAIFAGMVSTESQYMKPRAHRVSKLYGSVSGSIFAIRSIFKDLPFSFVFSVFTMSIFVFTFAFRVAESDVYSSSKASTVYLNMMWMTMITMTTVGYGDYAPRTPVGRLLGCLCVIWGGLFLSVTVVVVTKAFSMNKSQSLTLRIINKLEHKVELEEAAALFLRERLWRVWTNHKFRLKKSAKLAERQLQIRFKRLQKQQQTSFQCRDQIQLYNSFEMKFQGALNNIEILSQNSLKLINHLNERYFFNQWEPKKKKQPKVKVILHKRR